MAEVEAALAGRHLGNVGVELSQAVREGLGLSLPAYRIVHRLAQSLAYRLRELDAHIAEMSASEGGPPEDDLDRLRRIFFTDWGPAASQGRI